MSDPSAPPNPEQAFRRLASALGRQKTGMTVAGEEVPFSTVASAIPSFAPITGEAETIDSLQKNIKERNLTLAALDALGLGAGVPLGKFAGAAVGMVGKRFRGLPGVPDVKLSGTRELGGEISDKDARVAWDVIEEARRQGKKIPTREALHHPKLYEKYPELRDTPLDPTKVGRGGALQRSGTMMPDGTVANQSIDSIQIHPVRWNADRGDVLHEVGHGVQQLDGRLPFEGDPKKYTKYAIKPSERETRLSVARSDLSQEDLVNLPRNVDQAAQTKILRSWMPVHRRVVARSKAENGLPAKEVAAHEAFGKAHLDPTREFLDAVKVKDSAAGDLPDSKSLADRIRARTEPKSSLKVNSRQLAHARGEKAQSIVMMPIDEFLSATLAEADRAGVYSRTRPVSEFNKFTDSGEILNMPNLLIDNAAGRVTGHEGRARALSLKAQGETHMPVALRIRLSKEQEKAYRELNPSLGSVYQAKLKDIPDALLPQKEVGDVPLPWDRSKWRVIADGWDDLVEQGERGFKLK